MGIGDEIMASGHALAEFKRTKKRVQILDVHGRPRWSEMWQGLPWIAGPHERGDFHKIRNAPQCRPYIRYPFNHQIGQQFTGWRARDHVGHIVFTVDEVKFARAMTRDLGGFVVVEPHISDKGNPNKQWGWRNWQALVDLIGAQRCIQIGPAGTRTLDGVRLVETPTFRHGAAVLALARSAVLPEAGLHHAAGALGLRVVVLFHGGITPEVTGYEHHVNIASDDPRTPCGNWKPCSHCATFWRSLTPHRVADALRGVLDEQQRAA